MNHLNIIEVENLCFDYISYDEDGKEVGRNPVLKDGSLSVPEGQFLAELGHNGCGPLSRRTLRSRRRTWEFRSRKSASASTTH